MFFLRGPKLVVDEQVKITTVLITILYKIRTISHECYVAQHEWKS
jgi:hypothetical protein